jgi:two-component system phosphate regulon sensor histidine kinase PhoR
MFKSRFFWRNFLAYVLVLSLTTFVVSYLLTVKTEQFVKTSTQESLRDKLGFLTPMLKNIGSVDQQNLADQLYQIGEQGNTRITLIDEKGLVILETKVEDVAGMDNHATRPEILEAKRQSYGTSIRYSKSVSAPMIYVAQKLSILEKPYYLRVSVPLKELEARLDEIHQALLIGTGLGLFVSLLLALFLARRVSEPIADVITVAESISLGDYSARVKQIPKNDLGKLAQAINHLAAAIQNQISRREKMDTIRRQFSSNISHELKTPLTSIRGYVETLLGGAIHDKEHNVRFLEIIRSNIDRLINLVRDLLDLSQIEASEGGAETRPTNWHSVIGDIVNRHDLNLKQKQLQLASSLPKELPDVMGDQRAMSHILDNLIQNAIHYTPPGGIIEISGRTTAKSIELSVRDSGIGIAQKDHERIFERFYRVDSARSKDQGGTGLGLAIVKHLVIQLQGSISVHSDIGRGAIFVISLPKVDWQKLSSEVKACKNYVDEPKLDQPFLESQEDSLSKG